MPFTFSHPAIVLPLTFLPRKWYSLTGLVIGSLSPDFEYFLRMRVQSTYSHSLDGIFWFDLPLGILLAFVFHNVIRNSLFDNLPLFLSSRLSRFKQFEWNSYFKKNWYTLSISLIIGALSHLFWDSFTHEHGHFVQRIPALTSAVEIFGKSIPILKILQHGSTLIGGLIIAVAFFRLPIDRNFSVQFNVKYWGVMVTLAFTIIAIRLLGGLDYKFYGHLIATAISASLISLTLTSWFIVQKK